MIPVTCYYCSSAAYDPYAEENGYQLVKCRGCGLLYVNPRPSDEVISQAHQYGEHTNKKLYVIGQYDPTILPKYNRVLSELYGDDLHARPRTWLDIGCGWGEWIEAVRTYSKGQVAIMGTEPNPVKRESAHKRGLKVDYFDLDSHTQKYDAISLLNVYSHLTNPKAILGRWKALLHPGGELVLETGDSAHLSSKEHYRPFYLPDHLSFASESIVCGLLEEIGFEIVGVRKYQVYRRSPMRFLKEIVKWVLPNRQSSLFHLFRNYPNDMFIRARLKSA